MAMNLTLGCDAADPHRQLLIRTKLAELAARGGTVVRDESYDGSLGHVVMLDPEGNEFCVA